MSVSVNKLKASVNVDADRFETVVQILLSRLSDYPKEEWRLLNLSMHENQEGTFHGELMMKERKLDEVEVIEEVSKDGDTTQ